MTWKSIAAIVTAIAGLSGGCARLAEIYDVEIHVSRVYGVNDPLPDRLIR